MPVSGIGGFFFRAKDPEALKRWYKDRLGIGGGCGTDDQGNSNEWLWYHEGGPMVFEPFKEDTDYYPKEKQVMLNLRVSDLEGMMESLAAAGVAVVTKEEWDTPEIGRFARIHDPEGNPIELWEPAA